MAPVRAAFAAAALAAATLAGLTGAQTGGRRTYPLHLETGVNYYHGQDGFEVDFAAPRMRDLVANFWKIREEEPARAMNFKERNVFDAVADLKGTALLMELECSICLFHLTFKSVRILSCGHAVHEQCYRVLKGDKNLSRICPICSSTGPHTPTSIDEIGATVLGSTLLALEAQGFDADELPYEEPEFGNYDLPPELSVNARTGPINEHTNDEDAADLGDMDADDYDVIAPPTTAFQGFNHSSFLRCYLQEIFKFGQKVIDATIQNLLAIYPWNEGSPGLSGYTADAQRQTLNKIRNMVARIYRTVQCNDDLELTPVELTLHPLNRERTIQSLLSILVTVSDPPVGAVVSVVDDATNLLHRREITKLISATRRISKLVTFVVLECPYSVLVVNAADDLARMASVATGYMNAILSNGSPEIVDGWITNMEHESHHLAYYTFVFPDVPNSVQLWQTKPREYLNKAVGDVVWALFVGAAALFHRAAGDPTAVIFAGSDQERRKNLLDLHHLVTIAVTSPEIETVVEPAPEVPAYAGVDATSKYLRDIQVSLHRSLVAWLPTSAPISFLPLYPGRRDILRPNFAMHVADRLRKVQNVVNFFANNVDTSADARLVKQAFSFARQETISYLDFLAKLEGNYATMTVDPFQGLFTPSFDNFIQLSQEKMYDTIPPELHF